MIPGIKMDKGYDKAGLPGTQDGPLGHAETWCKGIDDLDKRCAEAYAQGARFAKWRNVLQARLPLPRSPPLPHRHRHRPHHHHHPRPHPRHPISPSPSPPPSLAFTSTSTSASASAD